MRESRYKRERRNWRLEEFVPARRDWTRIAYAEAGQPYLSRCRFESCDAIGEIFIVYDYTRGPGRGDGTEKIPYCRPHGDVVLEARLTGDGSIQVH